LKFTVMLPNTLIAAGAFVSIGFLAGHVAATGFPAPDSELSYSGLLTDSAGTPRTSTDDILVQLFAAETGGAALCANTATNVDLAASLGRFRVPLQAACAATVRDNGNLWAQIKVGTTALPRQKLGASPYAVSARSAQEADRADFADLAATVDDLAVTGAKIAPGAVALDHLSPEVQATLSELDARLDEVEARDTPVRFEPGGAYSGNAIYRGKTAPTGAIFAANRNGLALTGYRAAKYLCEVAVGSPTAHMCTSDEAARSAQVGVVPTGAGWISTGTSSDRERDCVGWTRNDTDNRGVVWPDGTYAAGAWPYVCNQTFPIHCCD
jgi:hypothetical protein